MCSITRKASQIEDLLTLIGAPKSSLELMEVKIVKEVRNRVNRKTNCETANITKTVEAALEQIAAIRLIESSCGIQALDEDLRELARLRLENPDLSLRELGQALQTPISRAASITACAVSSCSRRSLGRHWRRMNHDYDNNAVY